MFYNLHGQLEKWPAMRHMAAILRAAGLQVSVGQYAIRILDCDHFSIEHYGGDLCEPQFESEPIAEERTLSDARLVSAALSAANLKHRFEIYDENDVLVEYLHHDWQLNNTPSS